MNLKPMARGMWIIPLFLMQLAWSQVITGTISGTVTDQTGAVVPGANVVVRQVETGIAHNVSTDAAGRYRVSQLGLGNYEVTAGATGFQTMVRSGITLTVGREALVDFALQVGSVAESVTVTGEAPLVTTTSATVSGLVSDQQLQSLPLNGRSFANLVDTQPGVISGLPLGGGGGNPYGNVYGGGAKGALRIMSGATPQQSSYLLDGIGLTTGSRGTPVNSVMGDQLGVDAIREFTVVQSTAGAQFERAVGGVVNAVTRSGTNTFHGGVFEFLRNQVTDARDYFLARQFEKSPLRRNQFGATLGGPIKKDRAFFFTSYEGLRASGETSFLGSTLTPETRTGRITNAEGQVVQTVTVNPTIVPVMNLLPLPNGPYRSGGVANYASQNPYKFDENYGLVRLDQQLSEKDSFFGRLTIDRSSRADTYSVLTPVPSIGSQTGGYVLAALSWTRTLSPTVLNVARLGYTRRNDRMWSTYTQFGDQFPDAPGLDPRLQAATGIPLATYGVPGVSIYGGIGPGVTPEVWFVDNMFDYGDSLIMSRGRHSLTIGGVLKRYQDNLLNCSFCYGNLSWQTIQNFLTNVPFQTTQILGFVTPGNYLPDTYRGYRQTYGALFVQDDFQLRSNLTFNLGLRWEQISSPREANGKLAVFKDLYADKEGTPTNDSDAIYFGIRKPLAGFSPRFGFAWTPRGEGKTVIRGGFGIYPEMPIAYMYTTAPDGRPYSVRYTLSGAALKFPFPFADLSAIVASGEPFVPPASLKEPYVLQWNVSLERQFGQNWVVKVSHLGMRGVDQLGVMDPTQPTPIVVDGRYFTPADVRPANPNLAGLRLLSTWGDQYYKAGQLVVQKRFSSGLTFNSSYTWSRNLNTNPIGTVAQFNIQGGVQAAHNIYNIRADKGLAPINVSHNWITTVTYDLPFGPRRPWGSNWTGVAEKLLGGWSLNATHAARTGLAFNIAMTPRQNRCVSQTCGNSVRPDLKPGGNNNPVRENWTPESYYDPSQFAVQTLGYFGNLGRNTLVGPGLWNLDFSLRKDTSVAEGKDLSFRAEFFNILNHPNFAAPETSVFQNAAGQLNPLVGTIRNTVGSMRQVQFGLKFSF